MTDARARPRLRALFRACAGAILAFAGCGDQSETESGDRAVPASSPPPAAFAEILGLRNAGLLHAARDTSDGYAESARAFARCVENGAVPADRLNLARVLVLSTRWEEAGRVLDELRAVLADTAPPVDALYLEGVVAKFTGRARVAIARFEAVTAAAPAISAPWYQLGLTWFDLEDWAKAVTAFERLRQYDPEHRGAVYNLMNACLRLGRRDDAERWRREFQRLAADGAASPDPNAYIACKFTRVRRVPPIEARTEPSPEELRFEAWTPPGIPAAIDDASAVLVLDADGDRDADLYVLRAGPSSLFVSSGGRFEDASELSGAEDATAGRFAVAADYDNDALVDFFLARVGGGGALWRGLGEGMFQRVDAAGLDAGDVLAAKWVDHDHDGDLDLVVLERSRPASARGRARIARNNGDRTFTMLDDLFPGEIALPEDGEVGFAVGDFDLGNDTDLVFPSADGGAVLFLNQRRGPFARFVVDGSSGTASVLALDCDHDGDDDLVEVEIAGVSGDAGVEPRRLRVLANVGGGDGASVAFRELSRVEAPPGASGAPLATADIDADGDLDLVGGARGAVIVWRAHIDGSFERERVALAAGDEGVEVRCVEAVDLDDDGQLDLVTVGSDGRLRFLRNAAPSATRHGVVRLRLVGARDNRDGIGSTVELFAGPGYRRLRVDGPGGLRIGLGTTERASIDGFTVLWPNGIRQSVLPAELAWDESGFASVTQKAGLVVSCPFLWAHDGTAMRFVTDIVGIAPLDEWVPPGVTPHLDPEEYVRIDGGQLRPVGGRLRLVITEELRETTYLDRVELFALHHPADAIVHNDESTRQGAIEPLRVSILDPAQIDAARVRGAKHASELVRERDGRYWHGYVEGPTQHAGWVAPWGLEIELPPSRSAALLLSGRIAWQDSGVAFALHQQRTSWSSHRLEALSGGGEDGERVVNILDDVGFPCGMDRTLVVPLDRVPRDARALRLSSTSRLLWDRIAIARDVTSIEVPDGGRVEVARNDRTSSIESEPLALLGARLGWHGFSAHRGDFARHEQQYDFSRSDPVREFPSPTGYATRLGDAGELVDVVDDRLAVLVPGDALWIEFAAPRALDLGEATTYFLKVTAWAKESGFHNRTGRTIEPLPFHGMRRYPEDAARRDASAPRAHRDWVAEYQTRRIEAW